MLVKLRNRSYLKSNLSYESAYIEARVKKRRRIEGDYDGFDH